MVELLAVIVIFGIFVATIAVVKTDKKSIQKYAQPVDEVNGLFFLIFRFLISITNLGN